MPKSTDQQQTFQRPYSTETCYMLLDEAEKGLTDVMAGRTSDARASIAAIQTRRAKGNNLLAKINQLS